MQTADVLDLVKIKRGFTSDYQLAKAMQVPTQTVSQWRSGVSYPSLIRLYQLCDGAGLEPARVIAALEENRAKAAGRDKEAEGWRLWLEKLGGIAAGVVIGAGLIGPAPSANAATARVSGGSYGDGLYIMLTKVRAR